MKIIIFSSLIIRLIIEYKSSLASHIEILPRPGANNKSIRSASLDNLRGAKFGRMTNLPQHLRHDQTDISMVPVQMAKYDKSTEQDISVSTYTEDTPCRPFLPISVVFVMDGKYPFHILEDFNNLSASSPFYDTLTEHFYSPGFALDHMFSSYPSRRDEVQIGLASFTDWSLSDSSEFYCYQLVSTKYALHYKGRRSLPKNILPEKDTDGRDSVLNAIYFAAIDHTFHWGNLDPRLNVIVFVSNNKWKWAEDDNQQRGPEYSLPVPDGMQKEWPCEQGPVPKKVLLEALEGIRNRMIVIGLLTQKIYSEYKNFFNDAQSPENFHMLEIAGPDDITAKGIKNLIMPIITKKLCTCKVRFEFALAIDSTQTFIEKLREENTSFLDQSIPKIEFIIDTLLKEDPSTILHLTTFGDYPTIENHNANASYCYRYELSTSNKTEFLAAVRNVDSTYGGRDVVESSLNALLYTATEPKIKWSRNSNHTLKIIAIATDAYWKSYYDKGPESEYPDGPRGQYSDCLHRPPYLYNVIDTLKKERFFVLPMIYGTASSDWNTSLLYDLDYFMQKEPVHRWRFYDLGSSIESRANERCSAK